MSNLEALAAKEKGNAAFKANDFPTAIGHYTSAILLDRGDATYPLNRAAAYLKLGKNEDAERDCTNVLSIGANNVKALFRRGQARVAMNRLEEAAHDFLEAQRLEPKNAALGDELEKIKKLKDNKSKKAKATLPTALASASVEKPSSSSNAPKRRRVPIKIVGPSESSTSKSAMNKALASTHQNTPNLPSTSTSNTPVLDTKLDDTTPKVSSLQPFMSLETGSQDALRPVSTRSLKTPTSTTSPSASGSSSALQTGSASSASEIPWTSTPKKTSFKDAKQVRESMKPSLVNGAKATPTRVGGGIFRQSGNNTIFAAGNPGDTVPSSSKGRNGTAADLVTASQIIPVAFPKTLFDLTRVWAIHTSPQDRWGIIQTIPAVQIPSICKTSLEPGLLVSILETFLIVLDSDSSQAVTVRKYMDALAEVPRFGTLVLFLSMKEKEIAREVWRRLGAMSPTGAWAAVSSK